MLMSKFVFDFQCTLENCSMWNMKYVSKSLFGGDFSKYKVIFWRMNG